MATGPPIRIGALAPLSPPGWCDAGRHLLAGLELGVRAVNEAGGIGGRPLELRVCDTAGDPARAIAAMEAFAEQDIAAVAGEFHSLVARAAAQAAERLNLPFLCSSAVLDRLVGQPSEWVARLAPAQSHGWRIYADALTAAGHRRIAAAVQPGEYWASGVRVLRNALEPAGASVTSLEAEDCSSDGVGDLLVAAGATALLVLAGDPEPAMSIVRAVRGDPRLDRLLIGAPAGQPEFGGWTSLVADSAVPIPFLRYLPDTLDGLGEQVLAGLRGILGERPSFVGFEGYDTIAVLAQVMRSAGAGRAAIAQAWGRVCVDGSRGRIRFTRADGSDVWQWAWPPVQVAARDPADPETVRVLRVSA